MKIQLKRYILLCLALVLADGARSWAQKHEGDHASHDQKSAHYSRTIETYRVPDLQLRDHEGREIDLASALPPSEPVALNFIFTTCTTICPVMTATFSQMRRELGPDADRLRLVSISIDPEYDSPEVLRKYAARYKTGSDWLFLTGEMERIVTVLKAFDAYYGNKMGHRPVTFLRAPGDETWVRIEGLASGLVLADEYRRLVSE